MLEARRDELDRTTIQWKNIMERVRDGQKDMEITRRIGNYAIGNIHHEEDCLYLWKYKDTGSDCDKYEYVMCINRFILPDSVIDDMANKLSEQD